MMWSDKFSACFLPEAKFLSTGKIPAFYVPRVFLFLVKKKTENSFLSTFLLNDS